MRAWHSRGLDVPETHPTAAGHFPGHPVVPGALLLDEAARAIAGDAPLAFRSVKFLAPLRHGEALELHWQDQENGLSASRSAARRRRVPC
jgi:3-hydroxymyristoyl/3-hydroxydecanoyl-(acyl carrier protein) dehydratase